MGPMLDRLQFAWMQIDNCQVRVGDTKRGDQITPFPDWRRRQEFGVGEMRDASDGVLERRVGGN